MNDLHLHFSKQLIKGRVAEIIFEQMLRDAGSFTVLSFGYENILPELMHRQSDLQLKETVEVIRRAPDFAVINNDTHDVKLIEVKYRRKLMQASVLSDALRMYSSWKPSYLFIATPEGFYFGKVEDIVKDDGVIKPLSHPNISKELTDKYLILMNEFLRNGQL